MSIAIPEWLAPWLIGVGLIATALTLIVTIRAFIQLRRGEYYVIREEARRRVLRASLVGFVLTFLTVGALFIPRRESDPQPTSPSTPTQAVGVTPTRIAPTAAATALPTPSNTPQATATEPFIPTSTPQATLPVTYTAPLPSAVPPPGDARFEFWTLAEGVDENNQPVGPAKEFSSGIERIYLFFQFDGLLPNVPWTTVWYLNGELLSGGADLWEPERPVGDRHLFLEFPGGYPVGEYEVQVWLGDRLQIRAGFSVVNAG